MQVASKAATATSLGQATNQVMTDILADITNIKAGFQTQKSNAASSALQAQQAEETMLTALEVGAYIYIMCAIKRI